MAASTHHVHPSSTPDSHVLASLHGSHFSPSEQRTSYSEETIAEDANEFSQCGGSQTECTPDSCSASSMISTSLTDYIEEDELYRNLADNELAVVPFGTSLERHIARIIFRYGRGHWSIEDPRYICAYITGPHRLAPLLWRTARAPIHPPMHPQLHCHSTSMPHDPQYPSQPWTPALSTPVSHRHSDLFRPTRNIHSSISTLRSHSTRTFPGPGLSVQPLASVPEVS